MFMSHFLFYFFLKEGYDLYFDNDENSEKAGCDVAPIDFDLWYIPTDGADCFGYKLDVQWIRSGYAITCKKSINGYKWSVVKQF